MVCYVDDMRASFGRMVMCHMIADTDEELHAMADKIGVARRWHQHPPKSSSSHYDISLSMRARAVAAGAVEISWTDCSMMTVHRRHGDPGAPLVTPEEGRSFLVKWRAERKAKESPNG
jgi:hypothetical protein